MPVKIVEIGIGTPLGGIDRPQVTDCSGLFNPQSLTVGGAVSSAFKSYLIEVDTDVACRLAFGPASSPPTNASPSISLQAASPRQLGVQAGHVAIAF